MSVNEKKVHLASTVYARKLLRRTVANYLLRTKTKTRKKGKFPKIKIN